MYNNLLNTPYCGIDLNSSSILERVTYVILLTSLLKYTPRDFIPPSDDWSPKGLWYLKLIVILPT